MRLLLSIITTFFAFLILAGCSTLLRLPASLRVSYDAHKVGILEGLAQEGILFQLDDEYLKDIPKADIQDNCSVTDEARWGEQFFGLLKVIDAHPGLSKKFHVLRFKKGDAPALEMNREWDGAMIFTMTYQKKVIREPMTDDWRKKCSNYGDTRDQVTVYTSEWPTNGQIIDYLQKAPDKPSVPRFTFEKDFLVYLARRLAVFRMTPSLAGERSLKGDSILPETLNRLATQTKTGRYPYFDFWLQEIDQKSRLGRQIKFFNIVQDQKLAVGINLDGTAGSFSALVNQQLASTYLFVSYRSRGGEYQFSTLNDLDRCIKEFNPYISNNYWSKPERFLHPGYSCEQENPNN